jgi:coenzyme PQQ precursor peptide PqqA
MKGDLVMQWTKPDFQEITLNMEVTAYVNTDGTVFQPPEPRRNVEQEASPSVPVPVQDSR